MARPGYVVTTAKLAETIGRTEQRVNQLAREGVLEKQSAGRWDFAQNMKMYIAFLENGRSGETLSLEQQKLQAEVDYKRAQAETAELELAELRGEMHCSSDVGEMTALLVMAVRAAMLALPGRLAVDAAAASTAAEASAIIKAAVNEALEGLSKYEYDPDEYRRRVRERRGWAPYDAESGGCTGSGNADGK